MLRRTLSIVGLFLLGALLAIASEGRSGGLTVRVVDAAGQPLPGATVTISHPRGLVQATAVLTDKNGIASFPILRPSRGYIVDIAFPGFGLQHHENIRVKAGETRTMVIELTEGIAERVKVVSTSEVAVLGLSEPTSQFSDEFIQGLPVEARTYRNVLTLAPGAQDPGGTTIPLADGGFARIIQKQGDTESYDHIEEADFRSVAASPLSTFSIDVDTASYSNVRRFLAQGRIPPQGAVRIEELINYFDYDYAGPSGDEPFGVDVEVASTPWRPEHRLARIGIKGKAVPVGERPASNLVFLIDVSGSMRPPDKLPLLKSAMKMLAENLVGDDLVTIVVYAGASGIVLEPTYAGDRSAIVEALDRLEAGGSTAGGAGIRLAYDKARESFIEGGINRVILATDGDFNVGVTDRSELVELIRREAKSGVFLTVLGFGGGNLKDSTLEQLADKGNGNYAYIDSRLEARKVLVEEIGGTLVTIAKDVKIQVEFNPAQVAAYRLIGYENRALAAEDFNDDRKDAGEIGAGHTVTALYEIVPIGLDVERPEVDPLKYQQPAQRSESAGSGELFTLKIRYKQPDGDTSRLLSFPVTDGRTGWNAASEDFKFAASVAGFGMLLRGSQHLGELDVDAVAELAGRGVGRDESGYRSEFLEIVNRARPVLARRAAGAAP